MGRIKKRLFGISAEETHFDRRGFPASLPSIQQHLERIGAAFVSGYHAALLEERPLPLAETLDQTELELRGFAYEGAAMGLALSDLLTLWRWNHWETFLENQGMDHIYMIHVGFGWTLARLPFARKRAFARLDPLLRWLALDGYGFHEGYFHSRESIEWQRRPGWISGYAGRAFDQGLGRSLWFVKGAVVEHIRQTIHDFPEGRRGDLWSGVGLAATYAGGVDRDALLSLREMADGYHLQLAQGAAFAAKTRRRAGNLTDHTEIASEALCGLSAEKAAALTDEALLDLPNDGAEPAYEYWRRRIQAVFAENLPC